MLKLEEAQNRILATLKVLPSESVPLTAAHGRILAENIISKIDLPRFDNSAMDGYAVQAHDLNSAKKNSPVSLRLVGKIAAGEFFSGKLNPGECIRIFTGSPLPAGSDAVAMQEDTQSDPQDERNVLFLDSVKTLENVRFRGEDVKSDIPLAEPGERLNAGHLSLFGAVGIEAVKVNRQPTVGILATGSELREANQPLGPSEIYESNRAPLAALAKKCGAIPKIFPLIPDTLAETRDALKTAFAQCDVVVTSGGVSVGELDFVKAAFEEIGGQLDFWKISVKPGKPFVFGRFREKFLFGLPGNPVSAFVTFILLVGPALARMQGSKMVLWPTHPGTLTEPLTNPGERPHFVRVSVDPMGNVKSAGTQASHVLAALPKANGLVEVPAGATFGPGKIVAVLRLD